jgi:hypothetical protein
VYCIRAHDGEIRYIGQTVKPLATRLREHQTTARRKPRRRLSCWLTQQLRDHGAVSIQAICVGSWNTTERDCIAAARRAGVRLVNTTDGGDGGATCIGRKWTDEQKDKLRYTRSPEVRARMSAAQIGKKATPEMIERMSIARRGKPLSEAHRAALCGRTPWNKGKKLTDEHRAALSAGHGGRPRPWRRGVKVSEETRRRISAASVGRRASPETKARMAEGARRGWLKRKANAEN